MYIYWFLRGKTLKDNNYVIIKSIAISYVYISIIHGFSNIEFTSCFTNSNSLLFRYEILINVILILASVIFPYILYRAITSDIIKQVFKKLKIDTTLYDNEIEMLADFDKGAWLCVYLKNDNVVYEGSLGMKELEDGKRKYICLTNYYKYILDDNGMPIEPYIEDHGDCCDEIVLIFYDDIKRIEKRKTD